MRKVDKEEIAAELVEYCETSPSSLIWKTGIVGRVGGSIAGIWNVTRKDVRCDWMVFCKKLRVMGNRVVWYIHHGKIPDKMLIDHIDRNPSNNNISNLRCVPMEVNMRNKSQYKNNKNGGFTGIHWLEVRGNLYAVAKLGSKNTKRKLFSANLYGIVPSHYMACSWRKNEILKSSVNSDGYTQNHGELN